MTHPCHPQMWARGTLQGSWPALLRWGLLDLGNGPVPTSRTHTSPSSEHGLPQGSCLPHRAPLTVFRHLRPMGWPGLPTAGVWMELRHGGRGPVSARWSLGEEKGAASSLCFPKEDRTATSSWQGTLRSASWPSSLQFLWKTQKFDVSGPEKLMAPCG